jgi:O6-methylguanine-DNA--protein-cysteine methyltransferase
MPVPKKTLNLFVFMKAFMKLNGYDRVRQSERWKMIDVYMKEVEDVWLGIAYVGQKIVATALDSDRETTLRSLLRSLSPNADYQIVEKGSDFAERVALRLKDVHSGKKELKEFALATEYYSAPVARVLKVAACIPIGYVSSYGNIAKVADANPRLVGQIMASNPLYPIVACHRVVGADFLLVGYGGRKNLEALKAKLARLSKERKGFKSEKEISISGRKLKIYPVEYVIEKAKKQGLDLSAKQQRKLTTY